MLMGGWTSPEVTESTYVNAALVLPPHVLRLYQLPGGREPPPDRGSIDLTVPQGAGGLRF